MWSHSALMEATASGTSLWPKLTPEEMADIAAFLQTAPQE
jgi:cytochrome c